jgi:hypothetical protein
METPGLNYLKSALRQIECAIEDVQKAKSVNDVHRAIMYCQQSTDVLGRAQTELWGIAVTVPVQDETLSL